MLRPFVALTAGSKYCSGVLISPDFSATRAPTRWVLTCAHFFRELPGTPVVTGLPGRAGEIEQVRTINGTDLALVKLAGKTPPVDLPGVAPLPLPGARVVTQGRGGSKSRTRVKPGRLLLPLIWAVAINLRTRVTWGYLAYSRAIKGDSGAAIMHGDRLVGIQSLILDPGGVNLRVATLAAISPHLPALTRAVAAMNRP